MRLTTNGLPKLSVRIRLPVAADAPRLLRAKTVEKPPPVTTWGKYKDENPVIVKFIEFELTVPVVTRTIAVPAWAMSGAGNGRDNTCTVYTSRRAIGSVPLHDRGRGEIGAVDRKGKGRSPATAVVGLILVTVGVSPVIVNVKEFEVVRPWVRD